MNIQFPSKISDLEIYRLSKSVILGINFDLTNLNDFEISEFNKLLKLVNLESSEDTGYLLAKVFNNKGSVKSVIDLLSLLGIKSNAEINGDSLDLDFSIYLDEIRDISFIPALTDCVKYLLFYNDIHYQIKNLIAEFNLTQFKSLTLLSKDVMFHFDNQIQ